MDILQAEYIRCADTAKLIRQALKREFPGIKFSVKSDTYSGGASIRVCWTDGPRSSVVEAVTNPFAGSGFDGMIDLKYSRQAWLNPDGTVSFASTSGTEASKGSVPSAMGFPKHPDAKLVRFGADFVFVTREHTPEWMQVVAGWVCRQFGWEMPDITPQGWINTTDYRVSDEIMRWVGGAEVIRLSGGTALVVQEQHFDTCHAEIITDSGARVHPKPNPLGDRTFPNREAALAWVESVR